MLRRLLTTIRKKRRVALAATASHRAASWNNDRLSILWREVISLTGVRSARCELALQGQRRTNAEVDEWRIRLLSRAAAALSMRNPARKSSDGERRLGSGAWCSRPV